MPTLTPEQRDQANDAIERMMKLRDSLANLQAFFSMLRDLANRLPLLLNDDHHIAIRVVRAGLMRSAIGLSCAMLDRSDRRGNRASIGEVLDILKDEKTVKAFAHRHRLPDPLGTIESIRKRHAAFIGGESFKSIRRLRNDEVGHLLLSDDRAPNVQYDELYEAEKEIEEILNSLFTFAGIRTDDVQDDRRNSERRAKLFWDTYLIGVDRAR